MLGSEAEVLVRPISQSPSFDSDATATTILQHGEVMGFRAEEGGMEMMREGSNLSREAMEED